MNNFFTSYLFFKMSITGLTITDYSEKSFVVRGKDGPYKSALEQLGGKYNSRLREGINSGWIFMSQIR